MKILIISSSTGQGHDMAGKVVQAELESRGHSGETADVFTFKSQRRARTVAKIYKNAVLYIPRLYGAIYQVAKAYDKLPIPSPVYLTNRDFGKGLYEYIVSQKFDAVVASNLFAMEGLHYIRRKFHCRVPFYALQTDYEYIPFLTEPKLDGYFVPNQETKDKCVKKGVKPRKIHITGIPIDKSFYQKISKKTARGKLRVKMSDKVYLIIPGGIQSRYSINLCRQLLKTADADSKIFIMAGHNDKLKRDLARKFGHELSVKALDYINSPTARLYMTAADVILTKPGGLISTETTTLGTLIIHTMPIPGQEPSNARWFAGKGMAIYAPRTTEAARLANQAIDDTKTLERLARNQNRHIVKHSAVRIVDILEREVGQKR